jgi:hypothetical protein
MWFVALAVVIYALLSATIALSTADDCPGLEKTWNVFPPEWECKARPGFG